MREVLVLGTASQAPTRTRNHNGYLLRWDNEVLLFDPGEGTQRQMLLAGASVNDVTRICVTHFHGDHCLGLPGVLMSREELPRPVYAHYPASGEEYFHRLRYAASYYEKADVRAEPVAGGGVVATGDFGVLVARPLEHQIETYGYQLIEPDGRRMRPERLAAYGIAGPDVGELLRLGALRGVPVEAVSEPRPGQRFAFVMDTRLCDGVYALAERADLLVIEATFLTRDADLAHLYGHLTAAQAATVAAESGVRTLVLTHFSRRYTDPGEFVAEAADHFGGDIVIAADLTRVPVPKRMTS